MKKALAGMVALAALFVAAQEVSAWDCPPPTVFNPRSLEAPAFFYCPPGMIRIPPPVPRDRASRLPPIPIPRPVACGPAWVKGGCVLVDDVAICW